MRRHLLALRDGRDDSWNDYILHCLGDAKNWGQYVFYLRAAGLSLESVAFGNAAMCALATNEAAGRAEAIYDQCKQRFVGRWIEALAPQLVILMGSRARCLKPQIAPAVSHVEVSMHYAVGGAHRAALNEQLARIAEVVRGLSA